MKAKDQRELPVRKNNLLIQKARYNLSAKQFNVLTHMVAKVKPDDEAGKLYQFSIAEFCEVCGIEKNGKEYNTVKNTLQSLSDKSIWIPSEDGKKEILTRWFDEVMIEKGNGIIEVSFHKSIWRYVYEVRKCFTQYSAAFSYALASKYSKYIYDFCKSYEGLGKITVSIEEFSKYDCPNNYKEYFNLRQKVLDVAMREINSLTDIKVSYEPLKIRSRKYTHLCFTIRRAGADMAARVANRDLALMTKAEMEDLRNEIPEYL